MSWFWKTQHLEPEPNDSSAGKNPSQTRPAPADTSETKPSRPAKKKPESKPVPEAVQRLLDHSQTSAEWPTKCEQHAPVEKMLQLVEYWQAPKPHRGLAFLMVGAYGSGRRSAACEVSRELRQQSSKLGKTKLCEVDVEQALRSDAHWEKVVDHCFDDAVCKKALLHWKQVELLLDQQQPQFMWEYLLAAAQQQEQVTFFSSAVPWNPSGRFRAANFFRIEFVTPTHAQRVELWRQTLDGQGNCDVPAVSTEALKKLLASSFLLNAGQIKDAYQEARRHAILRLPDPPQITAADLQYGCRLQAGRGLEALARRITPEDKLDLSDLILPRPSMRRLEDLHHRIQYQGHVYQQLANGQQLDLRSNQVALFTGPSGTGKTMAAERLAAMTGRDLYKIDLSLVVSKYIGETEKNLGRLFSEAEDSNALIFFDEAEALFGKRAEVREARDRWANLEINYLLQRLDDYSGAVILATNLRQNIDAAFQRRIHFVVEFPFPSAEARKQIFESILGRFGHHVQVPERDVVKMLAARFKLTGAGIHNVVIDAAFRAVAKSEALRNDQRQEVGSEYGSQSKNGKLNIDLESLVIAIGREYEKQGKPVTEDEFGELFFDWYQKDIGV